MTHSDAFLGVANWLAEIKSKSIHAHLADFNETFASWINPIINKFEKYKNCVESVYIHVMFNTYYNYMHTTMMSYSRGLVVLHCSGDPVSSSTNTSYIA